ncbi:hypothetical protein FEM48_Zijuj12G0031200 [Ziziphus jujuba var. spinosa]|uniref:STAS domain-containing protein n=1 Tax=Ziziphus jujuba var. spinosa TaxID=714518 RepID=A0A978UAU9_ZIZJJ|nr:hypothetical protein FEM48_Zijuj12G0031200 [Ziziphus jujuba var. spinosa]
MEQSSKQTKEESSSGNNDHNNIVSKDDDCITIITETTTINNPTDPCPRLPFEIHKVCLPPHTTFLQKLKHRLFEIFFPDDPLSIFRNHTLYGKLVVGVQYVFPLFHWVPTYNFKLFGSDLISGITIASLAIPQGINYASLANLPPKIGLYSSFVPPLLYSLFGSSRHLAVGPTSSVSLVMGIMLSQMVSFINEPDLHLKLAFTSTFFAGLFQASLGLFRLGFIVDFLSKATLTGFMAGWSAEISIMGFSFLVLLLTAKKISLKKPKLFWISAAAPLTSVIVSTLLVFLLKSKFEDAPKIGQLPKGVNPPSAKMLYFHHGPHLSLAIETGIVTGILSLTEGIAVGRTFASKQNYHVDGNKEMIAIGLMNIIGSCCSCFVTTGTFSRSAVNYNAGAKTAFSNIVMAFAVLVTLLFLMPLFYYTPNVTLAAIIVAAVIGLIDYNTVINLWKLDKLDFLACWCSFLGVLFISVQIGLAIAVGVSVFKIILHVTRPNTVVLGNIPGTQIYQNLNRYQNAIQVSSFLILSIESPIFFANSTYLQERILRWVREEEERIKNKREERLKCVILDMTAVTAIDSSGIDVISELREKLEKKALQFVLVNPVGSAMESLQCSKVLDLFQLNGLYLTVEEAVADISSSWEHSIP